MTTHRNLHRGKIFAIVLISTCIAPWNSYALSQDSLAKSPPTSVDAPRKPAQGNDALILQTAPPSGAQQASPSRQSEKGEKNFSVGRLLLEGLIGGIAGSAAAYGILKVSCGDELCLGGALGGLAANLVVTPAGIALIGASLGGQGTYVDAMLGHTVVVAGGISIGLSAPNSGAAIVVSILAGTLAPFAGAILYEIGSERESGKSASLTELRIVPSMAPIVARNGLDGLQLGAAGRF